MVACLNATAPCLSDELHRNACSLPRFTFHVDFCVVYFRNMFYYGKSKAGSACFAGPAFVDPIKALEDPFLLIFRYADTAVQNREERTAVLRSGTDKDGPVFTVVLDSVLDQVLNKLLYKIAVSRQDCGLA